MGLVTDMRTVLRVSGNALDSEIEMLVNAALADMERVGVHSELLELDEDGALKTGNGLVWQAVASYCKGHFGFDNAEAPRFIESYYRTVCDLMNSTAVLPSEEE